MVYRTARGSYGSSTGRKRPPAEVPEEGGAENTNLLYSVSEPDSPANIHASETARSISSGLSTSTSQQPEPVWVVSSWTFKDRMMSIWPFRWHGYSPAILARRRLSSRLDLVAAQQVAAVPVVSG